MLGGVVMAKVVEILLGCVVFGIIGIALFSAAIVFMAIDYIRIRPND